MRHRFHSICPYFAMFPESFAERWISELSKPGQFVFDPFCGRGTTPFQAMLLGRNAVACDTNDVAFCLTRAKTDAPRLDAVLERIQELEDDYRSGARGREEEEFQELREFFELAFAKGVLSKLLYLREALSWKVDQRDCMIAALLLGALHGEMNKSGSYLSNQMPRTISMKPAYSIRFWKKRSLYPAEREVFELLRKRADFRYVSGVPEGRALVYLDDMRALPTRLKDRDFEIACAVTSPPYFDVTHFEEDQWLRLWVLGGKAGSKRSGSIGEGRYSFEDKYWSFLGDMWRMFDSVICPKGDVVLRIGSRKHGPKELERFVMACSMFATRNVRLVGSELSELRNRQTNAFLPGTVGVSVEVDLHFRFET